MAYLKLLRAIVPYLRRIKNLSGGSTVDEVVDLFMEIGLRLADLVGKKAVVTEKVEPKRLAMEFEGDLNDYEVKEEIASLMAL